MLHDGATYPVVLEEKECLKEGKDHVYNGYEHVKWSIAFHPVLVLKHLRDPEAIQNHGSRAKT